MPKKKENGVIAKSTKTVMVVDDEEDIRVTLKALLEKAGYSVLLAESGDDCLKKVKKLKTMPDLFLFDVMMPGTPTRVIVSQLKNTKIAYLTVVKVTEAEKEELLKGKNIVDFIQKPFDIEELLNRVRKILE
jgi:DNA-binding response OmpR family regulator